MTASPIGSEGYYSYDRSVSPSEYRVFDYTWIQSPIPGTFTVTLRDPLYSNPTPKLDPRRLPEYTWAFRNARALATIIVKPQNRQPDWPNPPRTTWYQSWTFNGNLPKPTPFLPVDQPNPKSISWYRSQESSGLSLTTVTVNPFVQRDWPLPTTLSRLSDYSYVFYSENLVNQPNSQPFNQTDYPNPLRINWYQDWEFRGNTLLPRPTPFLPLDQSLPPFAYPRLQD